ncbi:MAG: DUF177 domain-containing protein [Cyclobacteriaceae bacterium]|nr:DUF177 domain-containing protein [Cyclobacteriaceae bacterium]
MNLLKEFDIHISKLTIGQHDYSYKIDDRFFELFEYSLVEHGVMQADLILDKKSTFLQLSFDIKGVVGLICDRSLDEFDFPVDCVHELLIKFGDEDQEISDEVEMIQHGTPMINIAKYLYEFVTLEIPMKKLHPRYHEKSEETPIIFTGGDSDDNESDSDPRWNELKKIKNKD